MFRERGHGGFDVAAGEGGVAEEHQVHLGVAPDGTA